MKKIYFSIAFGIMAFLMASSVFASTLIAYYNTGDTGASASMYGDNWDSQSFTVGGTSFTIDKVRMKVQRVGSPGTLYVSIRNVNASGFPIGGDLSTGTIDGNSFETAPGNWKDIIMTPYTLQAGHQYAIVAHIIGGDGDNEIWWRTHVVDSTYAGGLATFSINGGVTWKRISLGLATADYMFEVYGTSESGDCDYYVGDPSFNLPQIGVQGTYTNDATHQTYLACLYNLDGSGSYEVMSLTDTCRINSQSFNPDNIGNYTYNLNIAYMNREWNPSTHQWETTSSGTDNSLDYSFTVCDIPNDEEGWTGFINWIMNLLCQWFNWC